MMSSHKDGSRGPRCYWQEHWQRVYAVLRREWDTPNGYCCRDALGMMERAMQNAPFACGCEDCRRGSNRFSPYGS